MANVNIEKVIEEWKIDSNIDSTDIVRELLKTSNLHAKYLEYFIFFKAKAAHIETQYNILKGIRKKYYRGELTQIELKTHGWDQYQGLKMSNSEFNQQADIDPPLVPLKERLVLSKDCVACIEWILKEISQRSWALKTLVDYQKFVAGV